MSRVVFEAKNFTVETFLYSNGRKGIILKEASGQERSITVNPDFVKLVDNEVIVRDYDTTEGIYDFLVQHEIVSKAKRDVPIGLNTAIACTLLIH